jgi:DNA-directed RNA polymerase sigma subunit (sigma70/sigma32)
MKHYDWAEPGDPLPIGTAVRRRRNGSTVFSISPKVARAPRPAGQPVRYRPLTPEIEIELVRAYREDGDLDALEWLVEAHRPMVVRMAKHRSRGNTPLKALVEYGMMGLRVAAQPRRPGVDCS